jgi:hypothetical protein
MMKYEIKLVPDNDPDADGRWIAIETGEPPSNPQTWRVMMTFFEPHVPAGQHIVQYHLYSSLPYCPFCKKNHKGGDTCLGHHP